MPLSLNGTTGVVTANLADSSVTTAKIANGAVVQADLGANVAGTGPAFSAYPSGVQALAATTYTKILFQTEEFDTNNNFASSTFTPTVAGYYQINGAVSSTSTTQVFAVIYKNGTQHRGGSNIVNGGSSNVSALVYLNGTTDYVELYGYFGTAQNTNASAFITYFNGALLRAA